MPRAFPRTLKAPKAKRRLGRARLQAGRADTELVRSVERVWRPLFAKADLEFEPARVAHFGDDGATPCAPPEEELLGLYCDDDRRIFFTTGFRGDPDWLWVVAHEVGHHVQGLRGTLDATRREFGRRPVRGTDLHLREELQADCYAGVWAHAAGMAPPDPSYHEQPEDEPGTPEMRRRWLMRGLRTGRPAACHTFQVAEP